MRTHLFRILLTLVVIFTLGRSSAEPVNKKRDQNADIREAVNQRQKTELKTFFLGNAQNVSVPQTPMAIEFFNDAVELYEKGEYQLAREILHDAIELDPKNPFAYELLGDIYNVEHDLEQAKEHYIKAYQLTPTDKVKEKIEKINRERKAEEQFSTEESEHFILKYRPEAGIAGLETIGALLERVYGDLSGQLGHGLRNKVVVLLYEPEEFREILETPHWISGLYDGKIRLPAYQAGLQETELLALMAHEMAHAFVGELSGGKAQPWINEGVAEIMEHRYHDEELIVLNAAVKTGHVLPLEQLMAENLKAKRSADPLYANLFYEQAYHLTQFLVQMDGFFKIKELLRELEEGKNSEEAVKDIYGFSIQELEQAWKSTLLKK